MKHIILLFACFTLTFSVNVSAQNVAGSVEVGVYSAYQFGDVYGKYTEEIIGESTTKNYGYSVGVLGDYHISPTFSVLGMINYSEFYDSENQVITSYFHYKTTASKYNLPTSQVSKKQMITTNNSRIQIDSFPTGPYTTESKYIIIVPLVTCSLFGKYTFEHTNLSVVSGVSMSVILPGNDKETYSFINNPDNKFSFPPLDSLFDPDKRVRGESIRYSDDTRTSMILHDGPIYQRTALQLGLTAGLQYDIPLFSINETAQKFVTLTPSVLFNYNLTTYSDYEKLRAWNVSAGFALKMGL